MSIITFYQQKLKEVQDEKNKLNQQILFLRDKLDSNSTNHKKWMEWWNEKSELNNRLCELLGSEKYYQRKIETLKNIKP